MLKLAKMLTNCMHLLLPSFQVPIHNLKPQHENEGSVVTQTVRFIPKKKIRESIAPVPPKERLLVYLVVANGHHKSY